MADYRRFLSVFGISVIYCFEHLNINGLKKRDDTKDLEKVGGKIDVVKETTQNVSDSIIPYFGR
jgi:hypothetical protein